MGVTPNKLQDLWIYLFLDVQMARGNADRPNGRTRCDVSSMVANGWNRTTYLLVMGQAGYHFPTLLCSPTIWNQGKKFLAITLIFFPLPRSKVNFVGSSLFSAME